MKVAATLSAFALLAAILHAQAPAAKPGSIEGTVTNSLTQEPVKKATVMLSGPQLSDGSPASAMTDATGHFHFENVKPGSYVVRAERDGFSGVRDRRPGLFSPITVAEDQHVQDIAVQLTPLGVVSGHVLDEDGDPLVRAQVVLLRYFYGQGRKQLTAVNNAQSNDLGEFEALNVAPGRYYVRVLTSRQRNIPPHTRWAHPEEAYPAVFYPNANEAAQAMAVNVAPGSHVSNIDFRLRKMPAYHIRGRVSGEPAGTAGMFGQIVLATPDSSFGPRLSQTALQPDG